ncbi:MAG: class II aldolase/adducin family protein [Firmicutes bacterium]|nr:class II aldolase/adducin family protein [Bacillota bacterium]
MDELCRVSRRAYDRGLVAGTGGNMSIRIPGTKSVAITATGVALDAVTRDSVIVVDFDGKVIEASPGLRPSKETPMHLAFYKLRPQVSAVLHVHPPFATALTLGSCEMPLMTIQAKLNLKRVPVVPVAKPGSADLAELAGSAASLNPESRVVGLGEHGIITAADSAWTAYYLSDLAEENAKVVLLSRLAAMT